MKFSTPRHSQDLNLGLCWEEFDAEVLVRRNFSASNDPPDLTRRVSLARCDLRLRECPDFLELHVCPQDHILRRAIRHPRGHEKSGSPQTFVGRLEADQRDV